MGEHFDMMSTALLFAVVSMAQGVPDSEIIQRPRWVETATARQIEFAYPKAAKHAGWPTGMGTVSCDITAEGKLEQCEVYKETPEGLGFGEAAQKVAKYFRMEPVASDGKPVAGGRMVLPIVFRPPRDR